MTYDYFYGDTSEQFSFYRIPKALFTEERFRAVSIEAKVLYGLLLDRMCLSARNGWFDDWGRVYIIFTLGEIMSALGCAVQKAVKLLAELEKNTGLIERKRQGLGKPGLIYVKNFIPTEKSKIQNCENHNSGIMKIKNQELRKSKSNNTDKNNTDFNDTEIYPIPSSEDLRLESKITGQDADRMDRRGEESEKDIGSHQRTSESAPVRDAEGETQEHLTSALYMHRDAGCPAGHNDPAANVWKLCPKPGSKSLSCMERGP